MNHNRPITMDSWGKDLSYSIRRHYVDEFYFRHVPTLAANSRVLDVGGTKILKRGQFDIEQYGVQVWYANLLTDKHPDVQCDAMSLPFQANCFQAIICSEVLEYVSNPVQALQEMSRVLQPGGSILICVPFLFRITAHPYDYGRYTPTWWEEHLTLMGCTDITIEWQGYFASVLVDMLRDWVEHKGGLRSKRLRKFFMRCVKPFVRWGCRRALQWDQRVPLRQDAFAEWYCSYTTGFGIRAVKA